MLDPQAEPQAQPVSVIGRATVFFNVTHGSRFFEWTAEAEMVRSRYFREHRLEVSCRPDEPWLFALAEAMYAQGNADNRINGRTERSISVGDVVEISVPGLGTEALVCETFGFRVLPRPTWWAPSAQARRRDGQAGELIG